jgi:hypothetical protein
MLSLLRFAPLPTSCTIIKRARAARVLSSQYVETAVIAKLVANNAVVASTAEDWRLGRPLGDQERSIAGMVHHPRNGGSLWPVPSRPRNGLRFQRLRRSPVWRQLLSVQVLGGIEIDRIGASSSAVFRIIDIALQVMRPHADSEAIRIRLVQK